LHIYADEIKKKFVIGDIYWK